MRKWIFAIAVVPALAVGVLATPVASAACPPGSTDPAYCPAPIVTTGVAVNVGATSATLNGTINGQGATVTFSFAYGTTTAYASRNATPAAPRARTPNKTLPASTSPQPVSATVSGLQPATTYHFRLFALNQAAQPGSGQDATFTTLKARPKLSIKARPKRDRTAPFRYSVSGKLTPPSGVAPAAACKGTVTIRIKSGSKTVKTGKAKVSSTCSYRKSLSVSASKLGKPRGSLRITGAFGGNTVLSTASKSTSVKFG
jgi:hypothetical protein